MERAKTALQQLKDGNRRFVNGETDGKVLPSAARRIELVDGQFPSAVILGCSDSRVPAEIVFDQGLGELFVIRVAGNVVAPSQIGSVEYAVANTGTRLVVVLGHTGCGAVEAAVSQLEAAATERSRNLRSIVERIRPSVENLLDIDANMERNLLLQRAVRANIRVSVDHLRHGSEIIEQFIAEESLVVVGAEYSLETGVVEFFE